MRHEKGRPARSLFIVVYVICSFLVGLATRGAFLHFDDFVFLGQARGAHLSIDYLSEGLFFHFSPLSRLGNLALAPLLADHEWVLVWVLSLFQVAVAGSALLLILSLFGRTWPALLATVSVCSSLSLIPLTTWWTAGMNILPGLAAAFLCFAGMVRLIRGGNGWWGVLSIAGLTVAVLDYELTMLVPGYIALWFILFRSRVTSEPVSNVVRRTLWAWASLFLIDGVSLANYRLNYYSPAPAAGHRAVLWAMVLSLLETTIPTAMGIHEPRNPVLMTVGVVVGLLATASLVLFTLRRSSGAWRGWVFAAIGWFIPCAALTVNRVGYHGVDVATRIIYFYLPIVLFVIGILEAIHAPARARDMVAVGLASRVEQASSRVRRRRAGIVALASLLYYAVGYGLSFPNAVTEQNASIPFKDFLPNVEASAAEVSRVTPSFSIINTDLPQDLVAAEFSPFNRADLALKLLAPTLEVGTARAPLYRISSTGTLLLADVDWRYSSRTIAANEAVSVTHAAAPPRPGRDGALCFTAGADTQLTIRLAQAIEGEHLVLQMLATSDRPTDKRVTVVNPGYGGVVAANPDNLGWAQDRPGSVETVASSSVAQFVVQGFAQNAQICLSSISVGNLRT